MNKPATVILSLLLAGAAGGYGYYYYNVRDLKGNAGGTDGKRVFVNKVAAISAHADSSGRLQRYGGEVEPQTTWSALREPDQEIEKTYVKVGDAVKVGTRLFTYDRSSLEDSLEQKDIDIEKKQIELVSDQKQLENDRKEMNEAKTEEDRADLRIAIAQMENEIKTVEFDIKQKQIEREKIEHNLQNTDVLSSMAGIVRSISAGSDSMSDTDVYITIMAEGDFRIKAKLNEQNVSEVAIGDPMLVYSRTAEGQVWKGTVTELDLAAGETNQQNSYYYGMSSDSATSSTSYAFYVTLDASDGLLLGEHVYLEKDEAQLEQEPGIWMDSSYLQTEEAGTFVWAESSRHVLEKRFVETGQYDALLDRYEITAGLAAEDYIAWPMQYMEEGMSLTRVEYSADGEMVETEDDTEAGAYL